MVPERWRTIKVLPIPKPGRDPNLLSSLGPISLMCCFRKKFLSILMKMIERYVGATYYYSGNGRLDDRGHVWIIYLNYSNRNKFLEKLINFGLFSWHR